MYRVNVAWPYVGRLHCLERLFFLDYDTAYREAYHGARGRDSMSLDDCPYSDMYSVSSYDRHYLSHSHTY